MRKRPFILLGHAVFGLLTAVAVAATLLPVLQSKHWFIRIFDYPKLQTFAIALLALGWYSLFYFKRDKRSYVVVTLLLAVIVVQGYKAWPYTPLGKKQVLWWDETASDSTTLKLFICNVLQKNTSYQKVIDKIDAYDPDVVITTETDHAWQAALAVLESRYPHHVFEPQDNTYGMHLYARFPLRDAEVRFLVEPDIPSIRTRVQLRTGDWITLYVVHPRPPVPTETTDSKERDAEIILVAKEARQDSGGVIVAGDFNDVAWSATTELFQEVSGCLDPRRGRGFYNTYHAKVPIFRWPLDHIFHSPHFKLAAIERVGHVDSDHFPMYVKLSYQPHQRGDQPKVKPDKKTERQADEAVREGKGAPN